MDFLWLDQFSFPFLDWLPRIPFLCPSCGSCPHCTFWLGNDYTARFFAASANEWRDTSNCRTKSIRVVEWRTSPPTFAQRTEVVPPRRRTGCRRHSSELLSKHSQKSFRHYAIMIPSRAINLRISEAIFMVRNTKISRKYCGNQFSE